jgi:hypothetical protein
VSLLALHGECTGVTITGVRWQLDDATLAPVVGWGVSNEVVADGTVTIRLSTGVLTVFDVPASTILPNPAPGPAANPSPGPAANPSPHQPSTTDDSQKDHIA